MSPSPEIEAGSLDRRVTLMQPQLSEYNDEILGWQDVCDVWAAVQPASAGRESDDAARMVSILPVVIVIRYRTDIDARWRVRDRDQLYEVRSLTDVARRRVQLQLTCTEIV